MTSGRITTDGGTKVASRYQSPSVRVRFYRLDFQRKDLSQLTAAPVRITADTLPPPPRSLPEGVTNMFKGGKGAGKGEFDSPTGIALDVDGNVLVADTNNGRIEKFSTSGALVTILGTKGSSHGQLGEPNGIAIDRAGNIYVAEVASNHRVQKLAPDGKFVAEWKGSEPGFYGPRRIAIGPDDSLYVVDQGRNRVR